MPPVAPVLLTVAAVASATVAFKTLVYDPYLSGKFEHFLLSFVERQQRARRCRQQAGEEEHAVHAASASSSARLGRSGREMTQEMDENHARRSGRARVQANKLGSERVPEDGMFALGASDEDSKSMTALIGLDNWASFPPASRCTSLDMRAPYSARNPPQPTSVLFVRLSESGSLLSPPSSSCDIPSALSTTGTTAILSETSSAAGSGSGPSDDNTFDGLQSDAGSIVSDASSFAHIWSSPDRRGAHVDLGQIVRGENDEDDESDEGWDILPSGLNTTTSASGRSR